MTQDARKIRLIMELRQEGITDTRVLAAVERVPRDLFVPAPFRDQAWENCALPIGQGQTISQPFVVALMTQALEVGDRMKVLEVGTGSGYQAAVLAQLCRRLYTIERHRSLLREAEARFRDLGITNVVAMAGDGSKGWPQQAPFDRIMVTAAAAEVPQVLIEQLAEDGVLVFPFGGPHGDQSLIRVRRTPEGPVTDDLGGVRFVPLVEDQVPRRAGGVR